MSTTVYEKPTCATCGGDPRRYTPGCQECAERQAAEQSFAARWEKIKKTREAVFAAAAGKKGVSGRIDCPACGTGTLAWAVVRNGHTRAECETDGCVKWID